MEPPDDTSPTSFFNKEQFSDVVVKFSGRQIYAHKIILAQHSGFFERAFLGQLSVATSPTIDLGDDDDPDLVQGMIEFMYHEYGYHKYPWKWVRASQYSHERHIDIFIIADKYGCDELREQARGFFACEARVECHKLQKGSGHESSILDCVARICGPYAVQMADPSLRFEMLQLCIDFHETLLQNQQFLEPYMGGRLFDNQCAGVFGLNLAKVLVDTRGLDPQAIETCLAGVPSSITKPRKRIDFFNDQRSTDITITYGGQKVFSHKVILASRSIHFRGFLNNEPPIPHIAMDAEDDPNVVERMMHGLYTELWPEGFDKDSDMALCSEVYLIALKYGIDDSESYLNLSLDTLDAMKFETEYPRELARVCGPDSWRFVDTKLARKVFECFLEDFDEICAKNRSLKETLGAGTLLNAKWTGLLFKHLADRAVDEEAG